MKRMITGLIVLMIVCGGSTIWASPIVVTFDDLPTPIPFAGFQYGFIPAIYQGLQWSPVGDSGWNVINGPSWQFVLQNSYGSPSAPNFAYNGDGIVATSVSGEQFRFIGGHFTSWPFQDNFYALSSLTVTLNGYLNGSLVGSKTIALTSNSFVFHTADFPFIDKLEFVNDLGGPARFWAMDDFTYAPVPEPTSIVLLASGLTGLVLVARRRK